MLNLNIGENCFNFFKEEISLLGNIKIIVALGKIAFDACLKFYKENAQSSLIKLVIF